MTAAGGDSVDGIALGQALLALEGVPGVGVDVEKIERFRLFDPRLFSPAELAYCARRVDSAECLAGRWCAKEAVMKACAPHISLGLREIEIAVAVDGRPLVVLPERATALGLNAEVSIAHAGSLAVAVAFAGWANTK